MKLNWGRRRWIVINPYGKSYYANISSQKIKIFVYYEVSMFFERRITIKEEKNTKELAGMKNHEEMRRRVLAHDQHIK